MYSSITASSFVATDENLNELLEEIPYQFLKNESYEEPFCHSTHKNLSWKTAAFAPQQLVLVLPQLCNLKYLTIKNFTHGAEMTIQIAEYPKGPFVQIVKDKFICKGKTTKGEEKRIDLCALPCRALKIKVTKGVHLNSNNIRLVGINSEMIEQRLGVEYFKLMVVNPTKIIFS